MAETVVRIPITNVYMGGDYTGTIAVGSEGKTANVILDTGSSTLALDGKFYDPEQDPDAAKTRINHPVDRIGSPAADSYDLYDCQITAAFHVIRPTLDLALSVFRTSAACGSFARYGLMIGEVNEICASATIVADQ